MSTEVVVIIATVFSSAFTWILTRKKHSAETEKIEVETLDTAVKIWREMAAELKLSNIDLKKEVKELQKLVFQLKLENEKLREEMKEFKTQNSKH